MDYSAHARPVSFVFLCALLSACAAGGGLTHYRPSEAPQPPLLERDDAEIALVSTLKQAGRPAIYDLPALSFEEMAVGKSQLRLVYREAGGNTETWTCSYAGTPAPDALNTGFVVYVQLLGCMGNDSGKGVYITWTIPRGGHAHRFADALFVLARGEPVDPAQDPEFQGAVQQCRASGGRSTLTEEARAHRVAAEEAVKEKRFEAAVSEYGEAVKLAPCWSAGRFNRALILAESGAYGAATREMKRYLLLEPDAENARQVQDKIYAWQAKVK